MVRVAGKTSQREHALMLAVQSWGAIRWELPRGCLKTKRFTPVHLADTEIAQGCGSFEDRRMAWGSLPVFTALCWTLLWTQLSLSLLLVHSSPCNRHLVPACAHSATKHTVPFPSPVSQICANESHCVQPPFGTRQHVPEP